MHELEKSMKQMAKAKSAKDLQNAGLRFKKAFENLHTVKGRIGLHNQSKTEYRILVPGTTRYDYYSPPTVFAITPALRNNAARTIQRYYRARIRKALEHKYRPGGPFQKLMSNKYRLLGKMR
jgi:hypothetical protein